MSSLSRLCSRATSSFSAACCSPASDTVRSYSGPNFCLSRSVLLRRLAGIAMTSTPAMTTTMTIAAIKIHPQTGIFLLLFHSPSRLPTGLSMQPSICGRNNSRFQPRISVPIRARHRCRLVVVAAAADRAARGSQNRQNHPDDQQDDPDHQENVGEGEGRDEAGQDEPEDDEDDAENDHGCAFLGGR